MKTVNQNLLIGVIVLLVFVFVFLYISEKVNTYTSEKVDTGNIISPNSYSDRCGNAVCDSGETCASCATDCRCTNGTACQSGKCVVFSCTNSSCNDNNLCTLDGCVNNACQHIPRTGCCTSNSQCASGKVCSNYLCVNKQSFFTWLKNLFG